jgi:hypothetical protein
MPYVDAHPGWADISLNLESGHIFVQENWHYTWVADAGLSAWNLAEKRAFHAQVDRQIWSVWSSGRFHIRVRGATAFARRFPRGLPTTEFDIRWVLRGGHWQVTARKMAAGAARSWPADYSQVDFPGRRVTLVTPDFTAARGAANSAGASRPNFPVGAHEFGHTEPDSSGAAPNPDEYNNGSANLGDTDSLMNIGRQVRGRHLEGLLGELNRMMPGTTFYV